jgi:hypothetical protein
MRKRLLDENGGEVGSGMRKCKRKLRLRLTIQKKPYKSFKKKFFC